ncbi:flagellar hook protein FlgE [Glaciihabitans sp. dw_435]|uniref:flagellar hook protein FlgE n=1 Tax=Glaciihabitans sp. dw_435 TaxID=2720081 RepID=UPI001BD53047|nr:flagellar hook protein FlgE [Glaciihabitans sp. dw_435]
MLRSLYSGISGLRSHQTMLDVTGNNIANVNTAGFKSSAVQFEDTLSQLLKGGNAGTDTAGGSNPAQVGLGVQVAGISTNFAQGASQATGRPGDMLISGEGFFAVKSGAETLYTRAGSFDFDDNGVLVTPTGGLVQGWPAANGVVNAGGALTNISLPRDAVSPAVATTTASIGGNLPDDAAAGTVLVRDIKVYDANGALTTVPLTFTKTATGWNAGDGTTVAGAMTFTDGKLTSATTLTVGGVTLDLSKVTGFAQLTTVAVGTQNGREAGTLKSYTIESDGTITGAFSNGATEALGRIALATFTNASGLEKTGGSTYRATTASGAATLGSPSDPGLGGLAVGYLEMSNVDLSQEFTNLIVAQRGFQANARIITTSDEVLQELTNLKR